MPADRRVIMVAENRRAVAASEASADDAEVDA